MIMLIAMFAFSFIGGLVSPYKQDQQFYRYEEQMKEYVGVTKNDAYRYLSADGQNFDSILQAKFQLAVQQQAASFEYNDVTYDLESEGEDLYAVSSNGTLLAIAFKDIVNADGTDLSFEVKHEALKAYTNGLTDFSAEGSAYTLDEEGNIIEGTTVVGYISRFVVSSAQADINPSRQFVEELEEAIDADSEEFRFTDEDGTEYVYEVSYDAFTATWSVQQGTQTYVYDTYAKATKAHILGTDKYGMDVLTRLMYGGRVSLIIGFIVVIIEAGLGIVLGGIAGYFGKWVDNLIMRIVDIFYCIPSLPLMIILGAAMDAMKVEPMTRMLYLMLILGFLGWPSIARLVRGQILSLREQEFMVATEACGIRVSRRIFKHLIPNVIPQLIVICTMSLGSTIITEATLSFLGIGVKFPFASWGNIITDVNDSYVMTHYLNVWIPAGICLLIAVLGFNFVGDGLRDAFDPKMKR
jgi:peptide/nickel transport system permease protein